MNAQHEYVQALILACTESIGEQIASRVHAIVGDPCDEASWPLLVVDGPGAALRMIHRYRPDALLVCVAPVILDESANLIGELRCRRPQIPLLALSLQHNHAIERAVRASGGANYCPLESDSDARVFIETIAAMGLTLRECRPVEHPPPQSRASPPTPRARGRPRRPMIR